MGTSYRILLSNTQVQHIHSQMVSKEIKHGCLKERHTKREDAIHLESMKQEDGPTSGNYMAMERGEEIAEPEMP